MVIVSDSLHHDKYAVNVFLSQIFQHLDENVRPFESIVMFSDGASSQFKQCFLLCSHTLMNRDITWNFFATSHGKGPVDGMVKRVVSREVMSGRVSVQLSQEFAIVAANKCKETKILHIGKEEIEATKLKLEEQLLLCCLPTPMTLASGGSPMFPLAVHQPASPSIWPAVQSLRRGLSTNPGVTMWCVCGCS